MANFAGQSAFLPAFNAIGDEERDPITGLPVVKRSEGITSDLPPEAATSLPLQTPFVGAPAPEPLPAPAPAPAPAPLPEPPRQPSGGKGGGGGGLQRDLRELDQVNKEQQKAAAQYGEEQAKSAQLKADAAQQIAAQAQKDKAEAAAQQEAARQEYERLQGVAKAEDDRYKNAGFRDFFADKGTSTQVLAIVSSTLGTLGQGLAAMGGVSQPNTAIQLINQAIDRDWALQKERLSKLKDVADASRVDAHQAGLAWEAARNNAIARQKDAVAATVDQAAAANGAPEARAKAQVVSLGLRQEAIQNRQNALKAYEQLALTRSETAKNYAEAGHLKAASKAKEEKPATEGQAKANAYLTVMTDEAKKIERLPPLSEGARALMFQELALRNAAEKNPTIDYTARITGVRKAIETRLKGSDKQAYSAYLSFLDPLVRQRTGANAPPSEVAALASPIMPAPGDKAADLADKRNRRRVVLESVAAQSNQGDQWRQRINEIYQGGPGGGQAPVSSSSVPAGAVRGNYRGRPGYMLNGRFYPDDGGGVASQ